MIFFDDAGNCEPVAKLGVLSAHCPRGLTSAVWSDALVAFARAKAEGESTGRVLQAGKGGPASNISVASRQLPEPFCTTADEYFLPPQASRHSPEALSATTAG
eukprot:gene31858-7064_t